eukprot:6210651-Pleurochrysis_carterae.AAC.4
MSAGRQILGIADWRTYPAVRASTLILPLRACVGAQCRSKRRIYMSCLLQGAGHEFPVQMAALADCVRCDTSDSGTPFFFSLLTHELGGLAFHVPTLVPGPPIQN